MRVKSVLSTPAIRRESFWIYYLTAQYPLWVLKMMQSEIRLPRPIIKRSDVDPLPGWPGTDAGDRDRFRRHNALPPCAPD